MIEGALPRFQRCLIREKFTKERSAARTFARDYFERYPKDRYLTEVESWRYLQSANIEFTMRRLREPIGTLPSDPLSLCGPNLN